VRLLIGWSERAQTSQFFGYVQSTQGSRGVSKGSDDRIAEGRHGGYQRNGDQRQQNRVFGCRQALVFLYELTNHVQHGVYLSVFLGYGFCLSKHVESFCAPTFIRN
jgi:hypothetical protein